MRMRFGLLLMAMGPLVGCQGLSCDEIPRDFSTPDATLRTFMRGFLEDCKEVEYRCLSDDLVARERLDFTVYNVFRNRLESDFGFEIGVLRFLDIEGDVHSPRIDPLRPTIALVKMTVAGREAEFRMVREADVWVESPALEDPQRNKLSTFQVEPGTGGLYLRIIEEGDLAAMWDDERAAFLEALESGAVSGVRVEPAWKIDSFPHLIEASPVESADAASSEAP